MGSHMSSVSSGYTTEADVQNTGVPEVFLTMASKLHRSAKLLAVIPFCRAAFSASTYDAGPADAFAPVGLISTHSSSFI